MFREYFTLIHTPYPTTPSVVGGSIECTQREKLKRKTKQKKQTEKQKRKTKTEKIKKTEKKKKRFRLLFNAL